MTSPRAFIAALIAATSGSAGVTGDLKPRREDAVAEDGEWTAILTLRCAARSLP